MLSCGRCCPVASHSGAFPCPERGPWAAPLIPRSLRQCRTPAGTAREHTGLSELCRGGGGTLRPFCFAVLTIHHPHALHEFWVAPHQLHQLTVFRPRRPGLTRRARFSVSNGAFGLGNSVTAPSVPLAPPRLRAPLIHFFYLGHSPSLRSRIPPTGVTPWINKGDTGPFV